MNFDKIKKEDGYWLAIFILFLLCFIVSYFFWPKDNVIFNDKHKLESEKYFSTEIFRVKKIVKGFSMKPLINPGDELELLRNYYLYNDPKRNEIIEYSYGGGKYSVVKIIKAIPGDKIEFQDGKILVNEEVMKNSQGDVYTFSLAEQKMLSLYIENNYLVRGAFFIFGDNINSSIDSRKYGAVAKNDILGKFDFNLNKS